MVHRSNRIVPALPDLALLFGPKRENERSTEAEAPLSYAAIARRTLPAVQVVQSVAQETPPTPVESPLIRNLKANVLSERAQSKARYVTEPIPDEVLSGKLICLQCSTTKKKAYRNQQTSGPSKSVCSWHSGTWSRKENKWPCCMKDRRSPGCVYASQHNWPELSPEFRKAHRYHPTPPASQTENMREGVVADCEMGTSVERVPVLLRVSAIDAETREVLLDHLVDPLVKIDNYITHITGVRAADIESAKRQNKCLLGAEGARAALWKFVGPETIVIGHDLKNDLNALRWRHPRVVDTLIMAHQRNRLSKDEVEDKLQEDKRRRDELIRQEHGRCQEKVDEAQRRVEQEIGPGWTRVGRKPQRIPAMEEHVISSSDRDFLRSTDRFPSKKFKSLAKQLCNEDIQLEGKPHCSTEDVLATLKVATALFKIPTIIRGLPEESWVDEHCRKYSNSP